VLGILHISRQLLLQHTVFQGGADEHKHCEGDGKQQHPQGILQDGHSQRLEEETYIIWMADIMVGSHAAYLLPQVRLDTLGGGEAGIPEHRQVGQPQAEDIDHHTEQIPSIGE
jgi:hypothetical protein